MYSCFSVILAFLLFYLSWICLMSIIVVIVLVIPVACGWYCLSRYGVSPFEYALGESGGSLQLAILNAQIKWPAGPNPPYPDALHQFVRWMLQPQPAVRPRIDDIVIHVDKLISKFSQLYTGWLSRFEL